jgi:hypothetical protein
MSCQSYFVPSGTNIASLSQAEQQVVKSLFYNRGHKTMIHTTKLTASAEWCNVSGKYAIKVETDFTPLA